MNTTEIENVLRRAPQPRPPGNLQQQLKAQALSAPRSAVTRPSDRSEGGSWLRRWWPALAPTAISLACAATLTVQQNQLRQLQAQIDHPAGIMDTSTAKRGGEGSLGQGQVAPVPEEDELARLKSVVASLNAEIGKLEQIQAENEKLRARLASRVSAAFTPEETKAMEEARDKALNIQCINNLKQLGLAVRVWSNDNKEMSPPNVLSMSNEIGSFKILVCPADTGRQPAVDAASFTPANCSYEYLAPTAPETEPQRIAFRCPIHGNLGLIDGSVQSHVAKTHPNWIVQRDGKLYMEVPQAETESNTAPPDSSGQSQ